MKEKKILLAAKADPRLVAKLDEISNKSNRSRAGMILTILEEYFKKNMVKPKKEEENGRITPESN